MIPPGQAYRPSGLFSLVPTVFAVVGALLVSLIVAGLIWGWEISPIPRFVVLTSAVQAFALGAGLHWMAKRAKLRNVALATVIGIVCGVVCSAGVFFADYQYFLHRIRTEFANDMASRGVDDARIAKLPPPSTLADKAIFLPKTGHTGFVGYLLFANGEGETISGSSSVSKSTVTGWGLWILWGAEALIVIFGGVVGMRSVATHPFCEDCDQWFDKPTKTLWLPKDRLQPLTDAVRTGDTAAVGALVPASVNFDPVPGSAVAEQCACGKCRQTLATVKLRTPNGKKGQYREKATLKHWSITPAMAAALRPANTPVSSVETH